MFWVLQKKNIFQFLEYEEAFWMIELFMLDFWRTLFLTTTFLLELLGN